MPDRIRTYDLQIRNLLLYPAELRAQNFSNLLMVLTVTFLKSQSERDAEIGYKLRAQNFQEYIKYKQIMFLVQS